MGSGLHSDSLCHAARPLQGRCTSSQAALLMTPHLTLVTQGVGLLLLQPKTGLWPR